MSYFFCIFASNNNLNMFAYVIPDNITQEELDEIYVQIIEDYNEYKTVSMIFKDNKKYD